MARKGEETKERILAHTEALVLEKGFSGTSIDDVLDKTGLTKGAFFYHFKNKNHLARSMVERFWRLDVELFNGFFKRADELSDEPLQNFLIFLKLFEEFLDSLKEPHPGCVFASYIYEREHFDEGIRRYIADSFQEWGEMFRSRLEKIMETVPPKIPVTAQELANNIMCVVEGAFILGKSLNDPKILVRQVHHYRNYLKLIFEN